MSRRQEGQEGEELQEFRSSGRVMKTQNVRKRM